MNYRSDSASSSTNLPEKVSNGVLFGSRIVDWQFPPALAWTNAAHTGHSVLDQVIPLPVQKAPLNVVRKPVDQRLQLQYKFGLEDHSR